MQQYSVIYLPETFSTSNSSVFLKKFDLVFELAPENDDGKNIIEIQAIIDLLNKNAFDKQTKKLNKIWLKNWLYGSVNLNPNYINAVYDLIDNDIIINFIINRLIELEFLAIRWGEVEENKKWLQRWITGAWKEVNTKCLHANFFERDSQELREITIAFIEKARKEVEYLEE